jgi:hypothetical protein
VCEVIGTRVDVPNIALLSSSATGTRPATSNSGARLLFRASGYAISANVSRSACCTSLLGSLANSVLSSPPYTSVSAVTLSRFACLSSMSSSSSRSSSSPLLSQLGGGLCTPNCSSNSISKSYSSVAVEFRLLAVEAADRFEDGVGSV